MKGINMNFLGLLLALLVVLFSCEQPVRDNAADKKSDNYELEVSCNRADGSMVAVYQALEFTFSDTMIPETLVVSGTANITDADWSGASWTLGDLPQDTLTLDPRALSTPGLWNVGEARTITLQCSSVNGQTVEQSFTFEFVIDLEVSSLTEEGAMVAAHEALSFTFRHSMVPATLVVSGDANVTGADWSDALWTEGESPNDTLTLDPRALSTPGLWNVGEARTLTLQCTSVNGQTVTQSFSYLIENAVYVSIDSVGANNDNAGTINEPLRFIQAGIDLANELYVTAEVRVAEGLYTSNYRIDGGSEVIFMFEGISVFGSYSMDFSIQDLDSYPSIIQDISTSRGLPSDPNRSITFDGTGDNITRATELNGFVIKPSSSSEFNAAIYCTQASPTINGNSIVGNGGSGDRDIENIYGIYTDVSSPHILQNSIFQHWEGDPSLTSIGIYINGNNGDSPLIEENLIYGGKVKTGQGNKDGPPSSEVRVNSISSGIRDFNGKSVIRNNEIYSSTESISPWESTGILIDGNLSTSEHVEITGNRINAIAEYFAVCIKYKQDKPIIDNNIFSSIGINNCYAHFAIYELGDTYPTSLNNNQFQDLFGSGTNLVFPFYGFYFEYGGTLIQNLVTEIPMYTGTTPDPKTLSEMGNSLVSFP